MQNEPKWVCLDCAKERNAKMPIGHVYTAHIGTCGICEKEKEVTEPRDFGRDRKLLMAESK